MLTSTFPRWGGDNQPRFVLDLCLQLKDQFNITVLAPHYPGARETEMFEGVAVRRFRYAPAGWEKLAYDGGMIAQLRQNRWRVFLLPLFLVAMVISAAVLIRRQGCDVVHAHWIVPQGLAAVLAVRLACRRPRLVLTSHGVDLHSLNSPLWRRIKRWVIRRSDRLAVVSSAMQALVLDLDSSAKGRLSVAPMGTDLQQLFVPQADVVRSRKPILFFAGRLVEKKGLRYLLDAVPAVTDVFPDMQLDIAGEGPLKTVLQQHCRSLGIDSHVNFLGSLPHRSLPARYSQASVSVFPFVVAYDGDQEGLGLVVVEAQGCECPVIASDIASLRDTVAGESRDWLVPPGDVDALAQKVISLLSADTQVVETAAREARARALATFDWHCAANRYRALYED